jgi:4-hydroxybenzoate polyprenyltransferase
MKRITHWPQLFLGLTFNWGALLGWLALTNEFNLLTTLPLYLSGIMWTLLYDTIYAVQDRECDKGAGILSSARSVEGRTKVYLSSFGIGHVLMLGVAGIMNEHTLPFFVVSVGGSAMHILWQLLTLDEKNKKNAGKIFSSNWILGGLVLLGICLDLGYKCLILEGDKEPVKEGKI